MAKDGNGLQNNLKILAIFFKFLSCVLVSKIAQKLVIFCSPFKESLDIVFSLFLEHFLFEQRYLVEYFIGWAKWKNNL